MMGLCERLVSVLAISAYSDHIGPESLESFVGVSERACLLGAAHCEVLGIEVDDQVRLSQKILKTSIVSSARGQAEPRCRFPNLYENPSPSCFLIQQPRDTPYLEQCSPLHKSSQTFSENLARI